MGYNANDEEHIKKNKENSDLVEAQVTNEIRKTMSTSPGRRWLYKYLELAHVFSTSIVFGEPDRSAFNEGERNIGNMLLIDIQRAAPGLYLQMIKEAKGGE